jgi:hypothetical protein
MENKWVDVKVENIKNGDTIRRKGKWKWSEMVKAGFLERGDFFYVRYILSGVNNIWDTDEGIDYKYQRLELTK